MPDKYDEHIEAILSAENPYSEISRDWVRAYGLFQYLKPDGASNCGCPTTIKSGRHHSQDGKLDAEVMRSALIPDIDDEIHPDRAQLEEFARIQRLADKIYNREVA